ncbi:hypothetical protein [Aporhodopirellula aestuarii]|uniref:Uncharacterized protein n=1 Tax=Aporhodopirellula aestuarii TaxID=2950107 RepID=A0ABT0UDQ1_9BACT|nr:hypothetical protein [Aporhodopirellula aestuarii]MCM2375014.1 hypothetical protein [Aporhodopirellula aestuarii]
MTPNENILSVIPGASEHQRLVVVHRSMDSRDSVQLFRPEQSCESAAEATMPLTSRPFCEQVQAIRDRPIVLRQESFSPAVGWFTQSEMELTLDQWTAMRMTMLPSGDRHVSAQRCQTRPPSRRDRVAKSAVPQRVLSADGEVIALTIRSDEAVPA